MPKIGSWESEMFKYFISNKKYFPEVSQNEFEGLDELGQSLGNQLVMWYIDVVQTRVIWQPE